MIAVIVGLAIGIGAPIQTSINARLRLLVGSPFAASLVSFLVGTVFLAAVTAAERGSLVFPVSVVASQPGWLWLGGVFGVVFLTGNIVLMPRLGAVQTVIMPVFGQVIMGLLIDGFGWFGGHVVRLTPMRVLGGLLVLLGVIAVVASSRRTPGQHEHPGREGTPAPAWPGLWPWRILGVATGTLSAAQTAVNGHLGVVVGSPAEAALISFSVGTIALLAVVAVVRPRAGGLTGRRLGDAARPWWMWLGGVIGAIFVLGNAYLAVVVGTGMAVVIVLVGLMAGSLSIDQFGWFGSKRSPASPPQIAGLLVMIAGAALVRLF